MDDFVKLVSTFVDAVALILALVLMLSLLHRNHLSGRGRSALLGAMFSFAIFVSMSDPINLGENGFFDMRGLLIGTAVALMGPVVGLMAAATALTYRVLIGGPGLESGIALIAGAYAGGLLWRFTIKNLALEKWKKSFILGLFISAQSAGIFFAPPHMQLEILTGLVPFIVISNVIGAIVINHLLSGELSFLSEAETSKIDAKTDHLTGLLNRRGLTLAYPDIENKQHQTRGQALITFDIDHFKVINDTYGHAVGDALLQHITHEVAANLRPNDVFARLGGDEFAVVLSQIERSEAAHIAERCRHVVASGSFVHQGEVLPVSISVGAMWMLGHAQIDGVMEQADRALYAAKKGGRNKVVFKTAISLPKPAQMALSA